MKEPREPYDFTNGPDYDQYEYPQVDDDADYAAADLDDYWYDKLGEAAFRDQERAAYAQGQG